MQSQHIVFVWPPVRGAGVTPQGSRRGTEGAGGGGGGAGGRRGGAPTKHHTNIPSHKIGLVFVIFCWRFLTTPFSV